MSEPKNTETTEDASATILSYDAIDWDKPLRSARAGTAPPKGLVARAQKEGARRKKIVRGEEGFFMNRSQLPANFRIPTHHHNHSEMLIILSGGVIFDDEFGEAHANDTIVIPARMRYGFVAGPEGVEFLTVRVGDSGTTV